MSENTIFTEFYSKKMYSFYGLSFSDRSYYCSCFPGFSGDDCGVGPLCYDGDKNFCENGGVCK